MCRHDSGSTDGHADPGFHTRRAFLGGVATAAGTGLAGCLGGERPATTTTTERTTGTPPDRRPGAAPDLHPDRPDGVYRPPSAVTPTVQGSATDGAFTFTVLSSGTMPFWSMVDTTQVEIDGSGTIHLAAIPWNRETGRRLYGSGVSIRVERDGEVVGQELVYPMFDQQLGYHYGENFDLPGDGQYTAVVSAVGVAVPGRGSDAGRFDEAASVRIPIEVSSATRSTRPIEDAGSPGAIARVDHEDVPDRAVPKPRSFPGTVLGRAASDDVVLVALEVAPNAVDWSVPGESYLAVVARTPYHRYVVPGIGANVVVRRDGQKRADGAFPPVIAPDLGYHYGASIPKLQSGDTVEFDVWTPPQFARHRGYETAFVQMESVVFQV